MLRSFRGFGKIFKNTVFKHQYFFANQTINTPGMGDSITEGTIFEWHKKVGEFVDQDELVAVIETDKVEVEIKSPQSGVITKLHADVEDTVEVGKPLYDIDDEAEATVSSGSGGASKSESKPEPAQETKQEQPKQETQQQAPQASQTPQPQQQKPAPTPQAPTQTQSAPKAFSRDERRVPLSKMRQTISKRLKDSQNTYALLTTFQEVDMSAIMEIRKKHQELFVKTHGVKLGFMSFFIKASCQILTETPVINAVIDGKEIVYRDYIDVSVAVATPSGLLVPVIRNCESLSFADVEKTLVELGQKGKNNKISLEDMKGGTFTISNGGVFGSMMGTPILNPPQSAILGMHSIVNRAVVRDGQIVARPMMYLALTYDHRLVDGREAAGSLKKLQGLLQEPERLLLQI